MRNFNFVIKIELEKPIPCFDIVVEFLIVMVVLV
jgi:hypothetical protein